MDNKKVCEFQAIDYFGELINLTLYENDLPFYSDLVLRDEYNKYLLDRCISYCNTHKMIFVSMAIIAE